MGLIGQRGDVKLYNHTRYIQGSCKLTQPLLITDICSILGRSGDLLFDDLPGGLCVLRETKWDFKLHCRIGSQP